MRKLLLLMATIILVSGCKETAFTGSWKLEYNTYKNDRAEVSLYFCDAYGNDFEKGKVYFYESMGRYSEGLSDFREVDISKVSKVPREFNIAVFFTKTVTGDYVENPSVARYFIITPLSRDASNTHRASKQTYATGAYLKEDAFMHYESYGSTKTDNGWLIKKGQIVIFADGGFDANKVLNQTYKP